MVGNPCGLKHRAQWQSRMVDSSNVDLMTDPGLVMLAKRLADSITTAVTLLCCLTKVRSSTSRRGIVSDGLLIVRAGQNIDPNQHQWG